MFGKKQTYESSGLLAGMTDWHSHILPGVDDGVKTLEESLAILERYGELGVSDVWLTPHIMEDIPNRTADLRSRFDELRQAYGGPVTLHLAAEYMLDSLFDERLDSDDLLPLGLEGRHLLVETSYINPPADMDHKLRRLMAKGYHPVLAHPERYIYMERDAYARYLDMGVIFQLNLFSLLGVYGKTARKKAAMLLKMELPAAAIRPSLPAGSETRPEAETAVRPCSLAATDLHGLRQLGKNLGLKELSKSEVTLLSSILHPERP